MAGKYHGLKRWQIIAAIHSIERELMGPLAGFPKIATGSAKDMRLRAERLELFAELRNRDTALVEQWENGPKTDGIPIAQP